jgi:hypothetical protein
MKTSNIKQISNTKRVITAFAVVILSIMNNNTAFAQNDTTLSLDSMNGLTAHKVSTKATKYKELNSIQVMLAKGEKGGDSDTYVLIDSIKDFHNGTIEVDVAGKPGINAPPYARGFIGIGFRTAKDNSQFEGFYIRPTNGRSEDQLQRNHSTQYFAHPDFIFFKSRKEAPGKYEAYADMRTGEWTHLKIEVKDAHAKFYVNNAKQPTLIVNDLKLGKDAKGGIGLWVDTGTEGYFANLKVIHKD